jgi:carboxylesterase
MRWQEWYTSALEGYHLLRRNCERVVVLGLSMGGLLSLLLAVSEDVAGVVVMAAPLVLPGSYRLAHLLRYFRRYVATYDRESDPIFRRVMELQREHGEPITGRVAYYRHSAVGVSELLKLSALARDALSQIRVPVMAIYSEKDEAVSVQNLDLLTGNLKASREVQTVRLKQSGHIVTNDVEYEVVFEAAGAFVARLLGTPEARPA